MRTVTRRIRTTTLPLPVIALPSSEPAARTGQRGHCHKTERSSGPGLATDIKPAWFYSVARDHAARQSPGCLITVPAQAAQTSGWLSTPLSCNNWLVKYGAGGEPEPLSPVRGVHALRGSLSCYCLSIFSASAQIRKPGLLRARSTSARAPRSGHRPTNGCRDSCHSPGKSNAIR